MTHLLSVAPLEAKFWAEHIWAVLISIGLLFLVTWGLLRLVIWLWSKVITQNAQALDKRFTDRDEKFSAWFDGMKAGQDSIRRAIQEHITTNLAEHREFRSTMERTGEILLRHESKISLLEGFMLKERLGNDVGGRGNP